MNESDLRSGRIRIGLDNKPIDLNYHFSKSLRIHYRSKQSLLYNSRPLFHSFDDERFLRNFSLSKWEGS